MTVSIREQLLDAAWSAFAGIPGLAFAEMACDIEPTVYPALSMRDDGDDALTQDSLHLRWTMKLTVVGEVEGAGSDVKTAYSDLLAQIRTVAQADPQWGGLAELTELGDTLIQIVPDAKVRTALINQDVRIQYVHRRTDPAAR